jgi:hypothetical protein
MDPRDAPQGSQPAQGCGSEGSAPMRTHREPFFGMPEDRDILGPGYPLVTFDETGYFNPECQALANADLLPPMTHPDAVERGIELPLGFMQHKGENRRARRAAVANFAHPEVSRRELLKQRQRQRRGKLDIETRRLQRKAIK